MEFSIDGIITKLDMEVNFMRTNPMKCVLIQWVRYWRGLDLAERNNTAIWIIDFVYDFQFRWGIS